MRADPKRKKSGGWKILGEVMGFRTGERLRVGNVYVNWVGNTRKESSKGTA